MRQCKKVHFEKNSITLSLQADDLYYTHLDFAGHILGAVYQMPSHHDVKACDSRQWYCIVHQKSYYGHCPWVRWPQLRRVRVTDFKKSYVIDLEFTHVRVHSGGHGACDSQTPYGDGHGDGELGGSPAAYGCV